MQPQRGTDLVGLAGKGRAMPVVAAFRLPGDLRLPLVDALVKQDVGGEQVPAAGVPGSGEHPRMRPAQQGRPDLQA
jgi:hypothetical protein